MYLLISEPLSLDMPQWETDEVYSFPLFTAEFCTMFLEEVEHYQASGLPIQRPNSMNNYGIVTNEIGMEHMFDLLQVLPLLFPT
jgi:hypothetical protein